jgi:isoleucyl-tRNA synthetase
MPNPEIGFADGALAEKWERLLRERSEVLKALEQARTSGIIGHSLDAKVVFENRNGQGSFLPRLVQADRTRLQDLLIVSQAAESTESAARASGEESSYDAALLNCLVKVSKADGAKCERCWKYDVQVGEDQIHPTVCARCAAVLNAGASV